MKKRVLFLINPVSGIGRQKTIEALIEKEIDEQMLQVEVAYTQYRGHAREISKQAVGKYDVVVAVGGDGTVNEVGSSLIGTDTAMAIIPTGSGNGLARFLEIPLKVNRAVEIINFLNFKKIDTLRMNEYFSLNVAGIGFDAFISHKFADKKKRGPLAYMQLITKEFPHYQSLKYNINIDGKSVSLNAFLISFANSSQYGNNVHIAPGAKIDDGLIDVCVIREFPKYTAPALLISLLDQSLDKGKYDEIKRARRIEITQDKELMGHVDGEPVFLGKKAVIDIQPLSLNVLVPPANYRKNSRLDPFIDLLPSIPGLSLE
ncbi:diacylglycerol kinase family lipid kinase [Marinilabiliaceae bacterium JC017]|nr:diacylglycerol kinase family lipid kinase [Marinilabiliaceae bacterium JC017]